ncbi:MAG: hypothetical protein ACREUU_08940, partial [Gammaproteobacteria bacterium]
SLDFMVGTIGTGIGGIAAGSGVPTPFDHYMSVWDATTGAHKAGWPRVMEDWQFFTGPAVADIDGGVDGLPEIIAGSGGYFVHAFNVAGVEPPGWPKNTGQWIVMTPSVGDIDDDGDLEVVAATRLGDIHVWDMDGSVCGNLQWRKAGGDEHISGLYGTDTLRPRAITDLALAGAPGVQITFSWTAPGEDGRCGQAIQYEMRRSSAPITPANFESASPVAAPGPSPFGISQSITIPRPQTDTYFAIRAVDDSGNAGHISNVIFVDGADEDTDGVSDVDEVNCGGDAFNGAVRPERIDDVFSGVDDDGDSLIDEPLPAGSEPFDCDGDGYSGTTESHVYFPNTQGDQDACGTAPDFPPANVPIGWPADLKGSIFSANKINIVDLTSFLVPVRRFGTSPGDPDFDRRWDVLPGAGIFSDHINVQDLGNVALLRPSMLAYARAFGGAACPWSP